MTTSVEFCQLLRSHGFNFFTGVPDSTFKGVINILENDVTVSYIPAVREDAAIGLATGAYLGGHRPMVLMQNSGLGVSINALASLPILYQIPMLVLIVQNLLLENDQYEKFLLHHMQFFLTKNMM